MEKIRKIEEEIESGRDRGDRVIEVSSAWLRLPGSRIAPISPVAILTVPFSVIPRNFRSEIIC